MNGYKCFYKGKSIDVYAETTYEAQADAAVLLRAAHRRDVDVHLCERDVGESGSGEQVIHTATY
jgi:hypothetical protein